MTAALLRADKFKLDGIHRFYAHADHHTFFKWTNRFVFDLNKSAAETHDPALAINLFDHAHGADISKTITAFKFLFRRYHRGA